MVKKQNVTLGIVGIDALCAIIWSILTISDITKEEQDDFSIILHGICAVIWLLAAILNYIRYRKENC